MSLHIAIGFEFPTISGGENSMLAVMDQLRGEVQFTALLPTGPGPLREAMNSRSVEAVDVDWRHPNFATVLSQLIESRGITLLHANSLTLGRRLGEVATGLPFPTSSHVRDIMSLSQRGVELLSRHAGIAAVSRAAAEALVAQGVPSELVQVIHNGIDVERFQPRPRTGGLHRELGIPEHCPLVATIGQICLRKGQDDFATAAVTVSQACPDTRFLIVGERYSTKQESRDFEAAIRQTFADAGIADRLHLSGFRDDIPIVLNEIDVLAHPARQEPFGRVLLEAAASGKAIVATDVGGTREILAHESTALLVPSSRPDQLAAAIVSLLTDESLSGRLGAAARRHVAASFSIRQAADRLHNFWREASAVGRV